MIEHQTPSHPAPALGTIGRVVRNSAINLAAILVGNLVAVVVLVRRVSPDVLGQYYLVFSVIMVVQLVVEAGISTVLTRRIVQNSDHWRHTVAEAVGLLAAVSLASQTLLCTIGVVWALIQGQPEFVFLFSAAGLACVGLQIGQFCASVFRAFERFEFESVAKIVQSFSFVGLLFWLVGGTSHDLEFAIVALAASHLLAALFLLGSFAYKWGRPGCRFSLSICRDWLAESVPLGLGDVCRRLTLQVDTVLLGILAPFSAAGIYNLAYRPLGFLRLIPRVILTVLFPSFSQMAKESRATLDRAVERSIRLLWMGTLPMVVMIVVCADHVVLLFGGEKYAAAALPMRLLSGVVCLSCISTQFRFYLTALGRQSVYTRLAIAVMVLEVVFIAASIPSFSYLGVCFAVLLGESVFFVSGFWTCHRLGMQRIDWHSLFKAALLAAVMGLLLWPMRSLPVLQLALLCGAASVCYFAACVLLRVLYWNETERLFNFVRTLLSSSPNRPVQPPTKTVLRNRN